MKRHAWEKQDRYRAACARYLEAAWAGFDPAGPEADSDWEPNFGSHFARKLAEWMRESNFSPETSAGIVAVMGIAGALLCWHIKHTEAAAAPQFVMAWGPNSFFPYGGGVSMCPGRFFAKQEIAITLAMLVAKFDVEFVEWTILDGLPSDRVARNDATRTGSVGVPPDRDMKLRWKKLW